MLLPYPKTHPEVYTAVCFLNTKILSKNASYLNCIDPICNVEFSSIDCFVESLGLRLVFCLMRGDVAIET